MSAAAGGGVLDAIAKAILRTHPESEAAAELEKASAAVAELIAADKEYDAAKEAARGFIEDGYESDSYGVYGSDFYRCRACDAESGAGVLNRGVSHDQDCVVGRYEKAEARRAAALSNIEGASHG